MAEDATRGVPGRRRRVTAAAPVVRLARLVRSSAPAPTPAGGLVDGTVVIEVGGARVTAARGADLQVLVMVLALLRCGGR